MAVIVFGGPSLEGIDLDREGLVVLPPARQGDLLKALPEYGPEVVGLLDCALPYQSLPTWHKEILHALGKGIAVVGGAAVGAHRAAELAPHGMEGIGSIYRRVASGELERDDEVLCDWEQTASGLIVKSVPLVVMRDGLNAARDAGIFGDATATTLVSLAEGLFWRDRTWKALLDQARSLGISEEERSAFSNWLPGAPDPVRSDAQALVNRICERGTMGKKSINNPEVHEQEEFSSLFRSLYSRDRPVDSAQGTVRQWCIGDMVNFAHPEIEDINRRALNRKLTLLLAASWDLTPTEQEIKAEETRIRRRFKLKTDEDLALWMKNNDLDPSDLKRLLLEEAKLHALHRWIMQGRIHGKNTEAVLDELKLCGGYPEWKEKTARRRELLRNNPDCLREQRELVFSTSLMSLIKDHLRAEGFPWHGPMLTAALPETGMGVEDLLEEMIAARTARSVLGKTLCPDILEDAEENVAGGGTS